MTQTPHMPARYAIAGVCHDAPALAPGLYIVSTPIGNLRDITLRALETLAAADLILCEDTRQSARLLDHYGITTSRSALHEHNERSRIEPLVARLGEGAAIALISDAGTPLISDPGFPLVRAVRDTGIDVFAVPGPSALLAALATTGLPTNSFVFHGFLPSRATARDKAIAALADRRETLVFYESPHRLAAVLMALARGLGAEREAGVALELTKRFERTSRGTLHQLAQHFADTQIKGEAVILAAGAGGTEIDPEIWKTALAKAMVEKPLRAAVDDVTTRFALKRKSVYDAALALKKTR